MKSRAFTEALIGIIVLTFVFTFGIAVGGDVFKHQKRQCVMQQWLDTSRGC
jgi:hypothetical protein